MPARKPQAKQRTQTRVEEEEEALTQVDIQYNPDIVNNLLQDMQCQLDGKCAQLKKDVDFMATSMQQSFHLELIKLPSQVKNMSLKKFQEEFGSSLENVTTSVLNSSSTNFQSAKKIHHSAQSVFQTPSSNRSNSCMRNPREGEQILSKNGSPLGEFTTVVKAPKENPHSIVPATPGCFVQSKTGDVIDVSRITDSTVSDLTEEMKEDAVAKMKAMMSDMENIMSLIQKSSNKTSVPQV